LSISRTGIYSFVLGRTGSTTDSLVPIKIVQLGEPATLTCALPSNKQLSTLEVHWYKQSIGDELKLISTLYGTTPPQYGQEIVRSRYDACNKKTFSNLTILKTVQEDEGIYHCGIIEWLNPEWSGTYLLVKGNTQRAETDGHVSYVALNFSERKSRSTRKRDFAEDSVYSQVKS
uniref:Ig-like domain-containing protein n=1 Tax=Pundamilia nyererei TaxID=303518 RepID=A0A3B4H378_9CICH